MKNNYKLKSFKDKKDAEKVLLDSRKRIDEIDNEIFDLICQRTSFAMDIALAKDYIGMPVYDKKREDSIHKKIGELSEKNHIDVDISNQIMDMLTTLSKNEQKEILRRNGINGKQECCELGRNYKFCGRCVQGLWHPRGGCKDLRRRIAGIR